MKKWLESAGDNLVGLVDGGKRKKAKAETESREAYEKLKREDDEREQEKRAKEFEAFAQSLVDEGKKRGMDEQQATKWAKRRIEEKMEKHRQKGHLIECNICGQQGSTRQTGGMVKMSSGGYRHQNCKEY